MVFVAHNFVLSSKLISFGYPVRNPHGRTGISGRGLLGRYGPNHAADPVVTRWKRTDDGEKVFAGKLNLNTFSCKSQPKSLTSCMKPF